MTTNKESRDPLFGLHKGLGVRGEPAKILFKYALAETWGVSKQDSELLQRSKVIYRLEFVMACMGDDRDRRALPFLYNTAPDPRMSRLDYQERQKEVQRRFPSDKYSPATLHRTRERFVRRFPYPSPAPMAPFVKARLRDIYNREARFAMQYGNLTDPAAFSRLVQRTFDAPQDEAVKLFLRLSVLVPRARDYKLIIAETQGLGLWTCAFSTLDKLQAHPIYQQMQDGASHSQMHGIDLVREIVSKWGTVGLAVDPAPEVLSDHDQANPTVLLLAAETLPRLLGDADDDQTAH